MSPAGPITSRLPNGVRLVLDPRPTAGAAIALFLDGGARDERAGEEGFTHALEHMLFKGAGARDARALARAIDALGGGIDAWTSRERLCLHAHIAAEDAIEALDLLADMLLAPHLPEDEWARERGVILAEIAMAEDDPLDWAAERHLAASFAGDPFGRPVLGDPDTLAGARAADLELLRRRIVVGPRLLVAAAGGIDAEAFAEAVAARFAAVPHGAPAAHPAPAFTAGARLLPRDGEQAMLFVSIARPALDPAEHAIAAVVNQAIGVGVSSMLFQELRERRGLAYSVGAHLDRFDAFTLWSAEAACPPERAREAAEALRAVLDTASEQIDEDAIALARRQLVIAARLAADQPMRLAERAGLGFVEPIASLEDWIGRLEAVSAADARAFARRLLDAPRSISVAGPAQAAEPALAALAG